MSSVQIFVQCKATLLLMANSHTLRGLENTRPHYSEDTDSHTICSARFTIYNGTIWLQLLSGTLCTHVRTIYTKCHCFHLMPSQSSVMKATHGNQTTVCGAQSLIATAHALVCPSLSTPLCVTKDFKLLYSTVCILW